MSMQVTVDLLDANMIAQLTSAAISVVQKWDVTLCDGVVLHVEVQCRPTVELPSGVIDAVNVCVSESIKAARSKQAA